MVQQTSNGHVVPRCRAPGSCSWAVGRNRHWQDKGEAFRRRYGADVHGVHGAVVLGGFAVGRRRVGREGRGLENGVVHDAAVGRGVGGRWADGAGAITPDLLELGGGYIGTVVGCDCGPELLTAGFVDGAEAFGINNLGLMGYLGVDAEAIVGLRGSPGSKGAGLGEEDLVLGTAGGGSDGSSPDVRATSVAHWRAVTRGLRVGIVINCHCVSWRGAGGAARGIGRDRRGALAAVATMGQLMVMKAAGELGLLEVCSNVLIWHLLHAGLEEIVLLSES